MQRSTLNKTVLLLVLFFISAIFLSMIKAFLMAIFLAGLFIAVEFLRLPAEPFDLQKLAATLLKALFILDIAWIFFNMVDIVDHYLNQWASRTESALDDHLAPLVRKSLRLFIVIMAGLMAIQSFGYPVTGVLASLGIGGLAFALAARDTVSNIFGSLMIIFDRPFHIGDWIKAGDMEGTVEEIGFRSTKIRTFAKTLVSVPNSVLANATVENHSLMPKRRIKLTVGITYDTTPDQMREAVRRIEDYLRGNPAINQEFLMVKFTDFGASSLDILVYCFTATTDWVEHLQARQDVQLTIMDILEELGLEVGFVLPPEERGADVRLRFFIDRNEDTLSGHVMLAGLDMGMIGVFDSGLGGLTVLEALVRRFPNLSFIYLGDHANVPYGDRPSEEIVALTRDGVERLFAAGCRLVLLGCNTATAMAARRLQQAWLPHEPRWAGRNVLGIVAPTVEAATRTPWAVTTPQYPQKNNDDLIIVFGTTRTVQSGVYREEIHKRCPRVRLIEHACPGLVDAIEGGDEVAAEHFPGLASLARQIGDPAVRNRGTIGGSLAHADTGADLPTSPDHPGTARQGPEPPEPPAA